jgi:integrase
LLFDFLLYSGARIDSANNLRWQDIDWENNRLSFTKTKKDPYIIPLFDGLRTLLERVRQARPGEPGDTLVFRTRRLSSVLRAACKSCNLAHMSHHTLRHVFATRCIESGVDIPTVSRWLGHKDGGALAMRVYGHLCDEHSQAQAKRVQF